MSEAKAISPSAIQQRVDKKLKNPKLEAVWKELGHTISRTDPLNPTNTIHYQRGKYLGKGGCARVFEFKELSTGVVYAGKVISKISLSSRGQKKLLTEIKIHRSLNHESVVRFDGFFEDNKFVYILLELCKNKSLMKLLQYRKRITEDEARYFISQIIESLKYLKQHRVIHRDLKLGNLLLDSKMRVKVADFGLAAKLVKDTERKKSICGTPNYVAPEILNNGGIGHSYEVDLWSLGVILYTMLVGRPPFESPDFKTTYQRIMDNIYSFPEDIDISTEAKNLIRQLLHPDAGCRPTLDQIEVSPFLHNQIVPNYLPQSALKSAPTRRAAPTPNDFWTEANTFSNNSVLSSDIFTHNPFAPTHTNNEKLPLLPACQNAMLKSPPKVLKKPLPLQPATSTNDENCMDPKFTSPKPEKNSVPPSPKPVPFAIEKNVPKTVVETQIQSVVQFLTDLLDKAPSSGSGSDSNTSNSPTSSSTISSASPTSSESPLDVESNEILQITKWVDESKRFGIGFQLSDETTTVYYNDDSKISFCPAQNLITYWEPLKVSSKVYLNQDQAKTFHLTQVPPQLSKKVDILVHFRHYFLYNSNTGHLNELKESMSARKEESTATNSPSCNYIQRFLRTKHALIFKLSSGTVQSIFFDSTKVIASSSVVTFVSSKNEKQSFNTENYDASKKVIHSRLKYVRDSGKAMLRVNYNLLPSPKDTQKSYLKKRTAPAASNASPSTKRKKLS